MDSRVRTSLSCIVSGAAVRPRRPRAGFTLLELILALSLSVVLLMAVGMAVNLHLRSFDSRQNMLQESQLARAILQMIAKDIRGVVVHYEQDISGVEAMLTAAISNAGGGDAGGGGGGGGGGGAGGATDDSGISGGGDSGAGVEDGSGLSDGSTGTSDLASTATLPATPGIYGNQYQLQIDISRLPRLDEYQQLATANPATEMVDIPSDVKTVSYFIQAQTDQATAASLDPLAALDGTQTQGLVRRQLDRAVTRWATTNASAGSLMQSGELLAPEVVGIEFQYFDGIQWLTEWDTEYQETLPMAIQIILVMRTADPNRTEAVSDPANVEAATRYYRLIVNVPGGEVASDGTTTDTMTGGTL